MTIKATAVNASDENDLLGIARLALEDLKALDLVVMDVRSLSSVMDYLMIASGTSSRHVKSLAENVLMRAKEQGLRPLGVEGERVGEWVLFDYGDEDVNVMQPASRTFYDHERLWSVRAEEPQSD